MAINNLILIIPAVITAFVICYAAMPVIIRVAELKHLIDAPDNIRKMHGKVMPTLGGIGIFSAFIISYSIWGQASELSSYPFFIAALFMLFLVGVKDDIMVLDPVKKLIVQIVAAIILVIGGGVVLTDFGGLFGINEIPWPAGVAVSVFIMVAIVNSFNLIDGIDGLAGGVGVIISSILGIWFWGAGFLSLAILSFSLSGALLGFLLFNLHPARIFMGDTGAMAVGFILGFLALEFMSLNIALTGTAWHFENGHVFAIAIFIVPVVDTLRVAVIRTAHGKNPFSADRNHTHHKLIGYGIPHHFASFVLWLANIIVIGMAYSISHFETNIQFAIILALGLMILPTIRFIYFTSLRIAVMRRRKETETVFDLN